jgi:hypothetical protein
MMSYELSGLKIIIVLLLQRIRYEVQLIMQKV